MQYAPAANILDIVCVKCRGVKGDFQSGSPRGFPVQGPIFEEFSPPCSGDEA